MKRKFSYEQINRMIEWCEVGVNRERHFTGFRVTRSSYTEFLAR